MIRNLLILAALGAGIAMLGTGVPPQPAPAPAPVAAPPAPRSTIGALAVDPHDANPINRKLMALGEADRRMVLGDMLAWAGERCPAVTRTHYQGSSPPSWNALWAVECSDGAPAYAIQVRADEGGSVKVLTCGELRALGGRPCAITARPEDIIPLPRPRPPLVVTPRPRPKGLGDNLGP